MQGAEEQRFKECNLPEYKMYSYCKPMYLLGYTCDGYSNYSEFSGLYSVFSNEILVFIRVQITLYLDLSFRSSTAFSNVNFFSSIFLGKVALIFPQETYIP